MDPEFKHPASIDLPERNPAFDGARRIARILSQAGHEAWLAGGSVRDMLMGLTPHDFDIATSAKPEEVIGLFDRTIPVGVKFGVVIVRMSGIDYEVATFRADCGYSDGRRPDDVRFTDLREDVLRRDFTMNGIVADPLTGEVVDLVGGVADIRAGIIRAIGDPEARFEEDRLRQIRAIRFAAQTGFDIEPDTLAAITANAARIDAVSAERISEEYRKLLESADPARGFSLAIKTGLLAFTIPELDREGSERALDLVERLKGSNIQVMWSAALEPLGPDRAAAVLHRLRRSNALCEAVHAVITNARDAARLPVGDVAVEKRLVRRPFFEDGLLLLSAIIEAGGMADEAVVTGKAMLARWNKGDLFPEPIVDGNDVVRAKVARGPAIASTLASIEDEQLRGRMTTREQALAWLDSLPKLS